MKHFLLFMICILIVPQLRAQEQKTEPKSEKFHAGLDYSYLQTNLKLVYMTKQSLWNDMDFGVNKLTKGQIDTLNSVYKYSRNFNCLSIEFGMILLNKPGGKWFIDGKITIGLAETNYNMVNSNSNESAMKINSGFSMPSVGLAFTFRYNFNTHWGLVLSPFFAYSFGTVKHIEDNTYPPIEYFTETRQNKYQYLYSRVGIMASYTLKGFSVSAGPGFYLLYNTNEYRIKRISPTESDIFEMIIHSRLISKSFIDAEISLDWRVIPLLTVSIKGTIGNDLIIHPSIRFNF